MTLPLEGIRILDFTIGQQGPYSTAMLSDMGAEVIKVEEPKVGDFGHGVFADERRVFNAYFLMHNRGKKDIAIDLKHPKGKEAILRLVKTVDVLVQNFRQGALDRLGLGYAEVARLNPKIIYASASGFGPKGPWRTRPALDIAAQGMGGIMSVIGSADDPPTPVGIPEADQVGGMILAYGIMVALFTRERTGIGQEVDASLLGSQIALQAFNITGAMHTGKNPPRLSRSRGRALWNRYLCGDGRWIVIGLQQYEHQWQALCKALQIEDLADDPRFCTNAQRVENTVELIQILDRVFASRPSEDWLDTLGKHDLICAPVNSYAELANFQQALENDYIVDYDHPTLGPLKMVGIPVRLSKTPGNPFHRAPEYGEHTEELLKSVGFSSEEIAAMREEGVIRA